MVYVTGIEKRVLPPHLSRRLFCSSFCHLSSVASALYNEVNDCALWSVAVFIMSIVYW
jgi:hypothetical protein